VRVTAGGLMPPQRVLIGTWVAFGIAVAAGIYLIAVAGWQLLLVGAASIAAGVLYTGGPRPYGYEGLGEVFVFLFFGVVAVAGSYYVQVERLEWEAFALSVPVGLLAAAILVVNNVRDVDTDRRAGKRTLAVRLGRLRARRLYAAMASSTDQAPLASTRAAGLGPIARRTAATRSASSGSPTFTLKQANPSRTPSAARRATSSGGPAARVRLTAIASAPGSPTERPSRRAARSSRAISSAARAWGGPPFAPSTSASATSRSDTPS